MVTAQMRELVYVGSAVAVVILVALCGFSSAEVASSFFSPHPMKVVTTAISIAAVFSVVYEKWIWRFNPKSKSIQLARKYKGSLISTYDHVKRGVTIDIKQSLLSVRVTLTTTESTSQTVTSSICEVLGEKKLVYVYQNISKARFREQSPIHYGTAVLSLKDVKCLRGSYYTDRKTTGDIELFSV